MHPCRKSISLFTTTLLLSLTPSLLPSSVGARHVVPLLSASAQTPTTQNSQTEVDKLFQEGVQQYRQGYYPKALSTYQRVLEICQQQNDKAGIAQTLNNIGEVYLGLSQPDKASEFLQQALAIRRELKDRKGEGETLDNLGSVYNLKNQYDKALETLQQALAIRREVKDRAGEGKTLRKIGYSYLYLKQNPKALETLNQALAIQQEIGDKFQVGYTLFGIASVYQNLEDYPRALEWYEKALATNREVGNRFLEGNVLLLIGGTYFDQFKYDQALETSQQALPIFRELGLRVQEYRTLFNIGNTYGIKGDKERAVEFLQQSLAIQREIKDSSSQLNTLELIMMNGSKADDLYYKGLYSQARAKAPHDIKLAQNVLQLARELKQPDMEANALWYLGRAYKILGDYDKAIEFLQQSVNIAHKIKELQIEKTALSHLSSIYFDQGKLRQTIELRQRQIEIAREQKNPSGEASVLNGLASIYYVLGEKEKGIELYQQALAKAREINISQLAPSLQENALKTLPLTLGGLSLGYKNLGEFDKALDFAKQRLTYVQTLKKPDLEAEALIYLGVIYTDMRGLPNAIESTQQALTIARQIKDPEIEADALQKLSQAYTTQGNHPQAIELANQALQIGKRLGNTDIEKSALGELSDIYNNQGNYQKALELSQQSLKIATEIKSPSLQSIPQFNLGHIYRNLGDYQKSRDYYQQALATMRQLKNRQGEGNALLNLANLAAPKQTVELAQQALTIFQEIKVPGQEVFATRMLSYGYAALENDAKAIESAQAFLTFARKTQNPAWEKSALNLLGQLHRKFGRKEQAIAAYQAALAIPTPTEVAGNQSYTLYGLASIYRDLNQPNVAITYYKQSINGIEEIRRNLQGLPPELQASFLQVTVDFNNVKTADIYRQLADLLLSQGRDKEAQQVLELLKVQEIRDVARGGGTVGEKPNVPLTQTETKIPAASESLIALGRQISECEQTNCTQKSALNDKLTALVEQFNQDLQKIDKEIRANRATDDVFFDPKKLAKAREIVKAQPGTVMIYPLVMENKLWLLMYSEGDVVKKFEVNVGQQELGETVVQFRKLLQSPNFNIAEVQATSTKLYNWLIKPLEPELKANPIKHLVFSLDRVTRYIPMSALFDGKNYLIENYSVYTVLSADLTDMRDRMPVGTQNTSVLAMGLSDAVPGFNPLPNVPAELDAIVRTKTNNNQGIYPGEEFLNRAFDFRTLRDNLTGYKILHLATHGEFVPDSSDKSYLLLGTGEQLTIAKINALTGLSNIHLVVLSACETALAGPRQDGVEIASVAYYFLNGGAKAVMASLWSVNDSSTSLLMQQFYKNLATGTSEKPMTKAEAMRQAQLSLLQGKLTAKDAPQRGSLQAVSKPGVETTAANNSRSNFSHPYYWAPFILIGNGL
jgi:CHAT domain-containing protein/tetratricopeptide (TPR) repeat protein